MTYSIIARDPTSGRLGVAVQSHYFAVGNTVPWVAGGVGAVASQAFAERTFGPRALEHLSAGMPVTDVMNRLLEHDEGRNFRQVAVMDAHGVAVAETGSSCLQNRGHITHQDVTVQGNMLASKTVLKDMIAAFTESRKDLAARLLDALEAAEAAGGDIRGRQSAAILVGGTQPSEPPQVDLRIDDAKEPLRELRRLLDLYAAYVDIGSAILGSGLLLNGALGEDGQVDEEVEALSRAARVLGKNPEAVFWKAVLLARTRKLEEADACFDDAIRLNPQLRRLATALPEAGFLPESTVARLRERNSGARDDPASRDA